jgi:hypothetical protein
MVRKRTSRGERGARPVSPLGYARAKVAWFVRGGLPGRRNRSHFTLTKVYIRPRL